MKDKGEIVKEIMLELLSRSVFTKDAKMIVNLNKDLKKLSLDSLNVLFTVLKF